MGGTREESTENLRGRTGERDIENEEILEREVKRNHDKSYTWSYRGRNERSISVECSTNILPLRNSSIYELAGSHISQILLQFISIPAL